MTSHLETSRYRDLSHFLRELVSVSKKSQYRPRKNLVPTKRLGIDLDIFSLKKSLGSGLENFGLKKVSVLISKDLVSKKSLYFTYFKIKSEFEIYYS